MVAMKVLTGWSCAALMAASAGGTCAAGGHHAVDDASILDVGRCEAESWLDRGRDATRLLHAGAACRVGPVELGVAGDYVRPREDSSQAAYQLQVKWAREVAPGWSLGLSAGAASQAHLRPRYQGTTLAALASWSASDTIGVHLNIGRDLVHQARDESRAGASIDWSFREGWQVSAERYRQAGGHLVRAGLRWEPAADWTVDLGRAHLLRGEGVSSWTLGLKREFGR